MPNQTKELLEKTKKRILDPANWTQKVFARDIDNSEVATHSEIACKWCVSGSLHKSAKEMFHGQQHYQQKPPTYKASELLHDAALEMGYKDTVALNDTCHINGDGHPVVMRCLDLAIAKADELEDPETLMLQELHNNRKE